ncbi:hypothetical protein [Clostridium sp. 2218st1_F5_2218SCRN_220325]|uniref:hypothetical protein n=1 Tax=Clostridium sp. 2218st1_F5_2218SCRN_220325 TaxID=3143056 RepID=UPI00319E2262
MRKSNKHFNINYENYKNYFDIEDKYKINEKKLLQFLIRLPYYIPIQDGNSISVHEENKAIDIFLFNSIKINQPIFTSRSEEDTIYYDKKYTIVEMAYISEKELSSDEKELNIIFDKLINKLNEIILSISIKMKYEYIYRINIEMLEICTLYRYIDLINKKEIDLGIFMLNHNIEVYDEIISLEKTKEILQFYHNAVFTGENPFVTSEELMLGATRQRKLGFSKESIMLAQSSVESFLRTLYKEFLIIEENNEREIEDKIDNTPFISIVKKEMHSRLGGNWNINAYGDVGNWYRDTYELRNKVSHGGYTPSLEEARLAVQRAKQLRIYVLGLLKNKGDKYSHIVKYL